MRRARARARRLCGARAGEGGTCGDAHAQRASISPPASPPLPPSPFPPPFPTRFPPASRPVLRTQEGSLEVFDLGAATRVHVEEAAHEGAVWSLAALPNKSGFVSGGADKAVSD